jgi:hypothetical protein
MPPTVTHNPTGFFGKRSKLLSLQAVDLLPPIGTDTVVAFTLKENLDYRRLRQIRGFQKLDLLSSVSSLPEHNLCKLFVAECEQPWPRLFDVNCGRMHNWMNENMPSCMAW